MVGIYRWLSEAVKWLKPLKMALFTIYDEIEGPVYVRVRENSSSTIVKYSDQTEECAIQKPMERLTRYIM